MKDDHPETTYMHLWKMFCDKYHCFITPEWETFIERVFINNRKLEKENRQLKAQLDGIKKLCNY